MDTSQWVDDFLAYLRAERGCSELTVLNYRGRLEHFRAYVKRTDAHLDWDCVDSDVVRGWIVEQMEGGKRPSSVNTSLTPLRSFYRYLLMMGRVMHNPMTRVASPKAGKPLPKFFRDSDVNRLLDNLKHQADGEEPETGEMSLTAVTGSGEFERVRAYLIILMLYATGMRIGELRELRVNDVDFGAMQLKVTGKRNKQRIIPMLDELADAIRRYLPLRDEILARKGSAGAEQLMLSVRGRRMTGKSLYDLVTGLTGTVTSQKRRSPHVFRHTFATSMINAGSDLQSVKELLGHASLNTTQVYTHTNFDQMRSVNNNAHTRG